MLEFAAAAAAGWLALVLVFRAMREGRLATILGVLLGVETLAAIGIYRVLGPAAPVAWVGQILVWLWLLRGWSGRMPPGWWSALVGIPAHVWGATVFLALPWSITGVSVGAWVPFAVALAGLWRSLSTRKETVLVDLSKPVPEVLARFPALIRRVRGHQPGTGLRIAHISDPHLGSFMSVARLRRICERAVAANPDLIVLTGDFFTFESSRSPAALAAALAPLRHHPAVFACRGNHDLESPEAVAMALERSGVRLLIDDAATVTTRLGPVQVVGFDFRWRDRAKHMRRTLVELVRPKEGLRIALLHDPGAFQHLPPGSADLVLSGHTHGGHVGLVSLGLNWTAVGAVGRMPDHGPWGQTGNRLYVSRAVGHYGFQLRIGVPAEESILELSRG